MRARHLLAQICLESAPAPATVPRPTTTPTRRPERRARPGTKPWKIPSIKPGEHTAPKGYVESKKPERVVCTCGVWPPAEWPKNAHMSYCPLFLKNVSDQRYWQAQGGPPSLPVHRPGRR